MDTHSQETLSEVKSSAYPKLERVPGKQNWVDRAGGLPSYIERIAKHLHYEKGFPIGTAIAIAVNTVKRWASAGTVTKKGGHQVTAATRAKAAKAVAEWEAKKKAGSKKMNEAAADDEVETDETLDVLMEAEAFEAVVEPRDLTEDAVKYLSRNFGHPLSVSEGLVRSTMGDGTGAQMTPEERQSVAARFENRLSLLEGVTLSLSGKDERAQSLAVANAYQMLSPGSRAVRVSDVPASVSAEVIRGALAQITPEVLGLCEAIEQLSKPKPLIEADAVSDYPDLMTPNTSSEKCEKCGHTGVRKKLSEGTGKKCKECGQVYRAYEMQEAKAVAKCKKCNHSISSHDKDGKCSDCAKDKKLDEAMRGQRAKGTLPAENNEADAAKSDESDRVKHLQSRLDSLGFEAKDDGIFGPKTEARVKEFQMHAGLVQDGVVGLNTTGALRLAPDGDEMGDAGVVLKQNEEPKAIRPSDAKDAKKKVEKVKSESVTTTSKSVQEGLADGFGSESEMGPTIMPDDLNLLRPVTPIEVPRKEENFQPPTQTKPKKKKKPARDVMFKGLGVGDLRSDSAVKDMQSDLGTVGYNVTQDGRFGPETEQAVKRFQRKYGLKADGVVGSKTKRTIKGVKQHLATIDEALMDQNLAVDAAEWQESHNRLVDLKRELAEAEKRGEQAWPELEGEQLEEATRGAAREVVAKLKRLPDGTFAPKGLGAVLTPGDKVQVPNGGGKGVVTADGTVAITDGARKGEKVKLSAPAPDAAALDDVVDSFTHSGPGGNEAMPKQVRDAILAIPEGKTAEIAGVQVKRQVSDERGPRWSVEMTGVSDEKKALVGEWDPNLSSPWVVLQSIKSEREDREESSKVETLKVSLGTGKPVADPSVEAPKTPDDAKPAKHKRVEDLIAAGVPAKAAIAQANEEEANGKKPERVERPTSPAQAARNAAAAAKHPIGTSVTTEVFTSAGGTESGDMVTGEVVGHKRGQLMVKTEDRGTIAVPLDKVIDAPKSPGTSSSNKPPLAVQVQERGIDSTPSELADDLLGLVPDANKEDKAYWDSLAVAPDESEAYLQAQITLTDLIASVKDGSWKPSPKSDPVKPSRNESSLAASALAKYPVGTSVTTEKDGEIVTGKVGSHLGSGQLNVKTEDGRYLIVPLDKVLPPSPESTGTLNLKNAGPSGKPRNVKSMGDAKLMELSAHPDVEFALKKRVDAELIARDKLTINGKPQGDALKVEFAADASDDDGMNYSVELSGWLNSVTEPESGNPSAAIVKEVTAPLLAGPESWDGKQEEHLWPMTFMSDKSLSGLSDKELVKLGNVAESANYHGLAKRLRGLVMNGTGEKKTPADGTKSKVGNHYTTDKAGLAALDGLPVGSTIQIQGKTWVKSEADVWTHDYFAGPVAFNQDNVSNMKSKDLATPTHAPQGFTVDSLGDGSPYVPAMEAELAKNDTGIPDEEMRVVLVAAGNPVSRPRLSELPVGTIVTSLKTGFEGEVAKVGKFKTVVPVGGGEPFNVKGNMKFKVVSHPNVKIGKPVKAVAGAKKDPTSAGRAPNSLIPNADLSPKASKKPTDPEKAIKDNIEGKSPKGDAKPAASTTGAYLEGLNGSAKNDTDLPDDELVAVQFAAGGSDKMPLSDLPAGTRVVLNDNPSQYADAGVVHTEMSDTGSMNVVTGIVSVNDKGKKVVHVNLGMESSRKPFPIKANQNRKFTVWDHPNIQVGDTSPGGDFKAKNVFIPDSELDPNYTVKALEADGRILGLPGNKTQGEPVASTSGYLEGVKGATKNDTGLPDDELVAVQAAAGSNLKVALSDLPAGTFLDLQPEYDGKGDIGVVSVDDKGKKVVHLSQSVGNAPKPIKANQSSKFLVMGHPNIDVGLSDFTPGSTKAPNRFIPDSELEPAMTVKGMEASGALIGAPKAPAEKKTKAKAASGSTETVLSDNIGDNATSVKDLVPGQPLMLANGEEYTYHKPANPNSPFHIIKPKGWTEDNDLKAKPMHGELVPPKIGPAPGEEKKAAKPKPSKAESKPADDTMDSAKIDAALAKYQEVKDGDATAENKAELDALWAEMIAEMEKDDPAISMQMESAAPHAEDPKWQAVDKPNAQNKALEVYKAAGGNDQAIIDALNVAEASGLDFDEALALVESLAVAAGSDEGMIA